MTAKEIIKKIDQLPEDELNILFAHYFGVKSPPGINPPAKEVTEEFKRIASEVFAQNRKLFKKLSDQIT